MNVHLGQWSSLYSSSVTIENGKIIFSDSPSEYWHLMGLRNEGFVERRIKIALTAKPTSQRNTSIAFNHHLHGDLAFVSPVGEGFKTSDCDSLEVNRNSDGSLDIVVIYPNRDAVIAIGTAKDRVSHYEGSGLPQYEIYNLLIDVIDDYYTSIPVDEKVVFVDVGGMGGLQHYWQPYHNRIVPVLFEPNPAQAAPIRDSLARFPGGRVIEKALGDQEGTRELNITASQWCSSLLKPNKQFLSRYSAGPAFEVERTVPVHCVRYDSLHQAGEVPSPDAIKIDTQGFDYNVLVGFGDLLNSVLAIQLESHAYPIYEGQKLLHDYVEYLQPFGLYLARIETVPHFDGDVVEIDAWFIRDRKQKLNSREVAKMETIKKAWKLI